MHIKEHDDVIYWVEQDIVGKKLELFKVTCPKINSFLKPTLCSTCIHLEALGAFECIHVVHRVGFRKLLVLGRLTFKCCNVE